MTPASSPTPRNALRAGDVPASPCPEVRHARFPMNASRSMREESPVSVEYTVRVIVAEGIR